MPNLTPTDEQRAALDLFAHGDSMVVEALAGTGKTSLLRMIAESTDRPGQYIAFNKQIVKDVERKLPLHVRANTAHSLAFRAVGHLYRDRFGAERMRSDHIADILGLKSIIVRVDGHRKTLTPGYLAGLVMRSLETFCQSADPEPTHRHVNYVEGIDEPTLDGRRTYDNNYHIAKAMEEFLQIAWVDVQKIEGGRLPFKHSHYLKSWALNDPVIDAEFVLFDECQDVIPVVDGIIAAQNAQTIFCGDANQAIYEWAGARNSIEKMKEKGLPASPMTQSFRFGPEIAATANEVLDRLGSSIHLRGTESVRSTTGFSSERPNAILTRTNAKAVTEVLNAQASGIEAALVGGGKEILSFARAAGDLMRDGRTSHPELACFDSWSEVVEYVGTDEQGDELQLQVSLVNQFGVATIVKALDKLPSEKKADLIISTAHRSKGIQWPHVRIASDFDKDENGPKGPLTVEELRLRYVAFTRAQYHLDASACQTAAQKLEDGVDSHD